MSTEQLVVHKDFCIGCFKRLSHHRVRVGVRTCPDCTPGSTPRPRRIEHIFRDLLLVHPLLKDAPPSTQDDRSAPLGGKDCGLGAAMFPDLAWQCNDRWVIVEIDEHSHVDYSANCELRRVSNLAEAVHRVMEQTVPVLIVRCNPDEWDGGRAGLIDRVNALALRVSTLLTMDLTAYTDAVPYVWYMYYHTAAQTHVNAALAAAPYVRVMDTCR